MSEIETFQVNGNTVTIHSDDDGETGNPRDAFNVGVMLANGHRNYTLGDEKYQDGTPEYAQAAEAWATIFEEAHSLAEAAQQFKLWAMATVGATVVLPLWLLDHSGLAMRTGPFGEDPGNWDSGIVGWIFDTTRTREEAGTTPEQIEEVLHHEVKDYDMFLQGEVYGYTIEDPDGNELDSLWGMLGLDYVKERAREEAETHVAAIWHAVVLDKRGGVQGVHGPYETKEDAEADGLPVILKPPTERPVPMIAPQNPANTAWRGGELYTLHLTRAEERAKLAEGFTYPVTVPAT